MARNTGTIWRTIAGFAIAPIVPGALIAGTLLAINEREDAQLVFLASIYFGYPIALVFGAPIHALLKRNRLTQLLAYAGAGAALGAFLHLAGPMLFNALMDLNGLSGATVTFALFLLPVAIIGATVAATVFWLIVRPDRQARAMV